MDKACKVLIVRAFLVAGRRRKAMRREEWRRRERRWKAFVRTQAQQRLLFVLFLAGISTSIGLDHL